MLLKRSGTLRIVNGATIASGWLELPTGMAFATIDVDSDPPPHALRQDAISNAFYTIELPPLLRQFLGLPSVMSGKGGVAGLRVKVDPKGKPAPCLRVEPAG